uniref:Uncharacterized protein n=1 Tax=Staphylococcus warneri TaxID=1292 RepID=Q75V32_STAWA|nr:hypothetical protein [Staphylococcus warneri]
MISTTSKIACHDISNTPSTFQNSSLFTPIFQRKQVTAKALFCAPALTFLYTEHLKKSYSVKSIRDNDATFGVTQHS